MKKAELKKKLTRGEWEKCDFAEIKKKFSYEELEDMFHEAWRSKDEISFMQALYKIFPFDDFYQFLKRIYCFEKCYGEWGEEVAEFATILPPDGLKKCLIHLAEDDAPEGICDDTQVALFDALSKDDFLEVWQKVREHVCTCYYCNAWDANNEDKSDGYPLCLKAVEKIFEKYSKDEAEQFFMETDIGLSHDAWKLVFNHFLEENKLMSWLAVYINNEYWMDNHEWSLISKHCSMDDHCKLAANFILHWEYWGGSLDDALEGACWKDFRVTDLVPNSQYALLTLQYLYFIVDKDNYGEEEPEIISEYMAVLLSSSPHALNVLEAIIVYGKKCFKDFMQKDKMIMEVTEQLFDMESANVRKVFYNLGCQKMQSALDEAQKPVFHYK